MITNAIILAGGFGTRLSVFKDERPKPLMPVNNEPLLQAQLRRLAKAGVKNVQLSLFHGAGQVQSALEKMDTYGMSVSLSVEEKPLGTAGAIRLSFSFPGPDASCYVLNGDIVTSLPLEEIGRFHDEKGGAATIWGINVQDTARYGVLEMGEGDRVKRFVEKPGPGESPSKVINAGAYVLTREIVGLIPAGKQASVERDTFPEALGKGMKLFAFVKDAYWMDIGTPETYLRANLDANGGKSVQGKDCRVAASAKIEESLLLEGCKVGEKALIRRSVLGRFCEIAEGSVIEGQFLPEGSHA